MYPMATSVEVYSDKEMTTFVGETHVDNLDKFYGLMRDMILHPGWRADDFERVRDDSVNALRVSLRGNNDEELGKEELYNVIYDRPALRSRKSGHRFGAPEDDGRRLTGLLPAALHSGQPHHRNRRRLSA